MSRAATKKIEPITAKTKKKIRLSISIIFEVSVFED
jgi:hypothetical protein